MAFGRLERSVTSQPLSEINMTPLIDVMLVLLVIFMVAAPLMTSSLKMELPKAGAAPPSEPVQALALELDAAGSLRLNHQVVSMAELPQTLKVAAGQEPQPDVLIRADRQVPYGRIAELISQIQVAGLTHIGFVTQPAN